MRRRPQGSWRRRWRSCWHEPLERDRDGKSEDSGAAWPALLEDTMGGHCLLLEGLRCKEGVDYLTSPFSQGSHHLLHLGTNCACLYWLFCMIGNPTMEQASGLCRLVLDFLSHEDVDNPFKRLSRSSHDHRSPRPLALPMSIGPVHVHRSSPCP